MAGTTSKKSARFVAKKAAAVRVVAKPAKPRNTVATSAIPRRRPRVPQEGSSAAPNSASQMIDQRTGESGDSQTASKTASKATSKAASKSGYQNPARKCGAPGPTTCVVGSVGASTVRFSATLFRPKATAKAGSGGSGDWTFLTLPKEASAKLPSRGQVSVEGTFNGLPFQATLEPDGKGGHWLKVDRKLSEAAGTPGSGGLKPGDVVTLEIAPVAEEPEPTVPPDLKEALAAAAPKAREVWSDITPAARRDFIHWIVSPKRPETRVKRVATACDMLAKGKRRPCCFDRSGMYDKSLSCPVADETTSVARGE